MKKKEKGIKIKRIKSIGTKRRLQPYSSILVEKLGENGQGYLD